MAKYEMLIGGKMVAGGGGTFDVINPATGKAFAQAPNATKDQVDEAVQAAKKAFPAWAAMDAAERGKLVLEAAGVLNLEAEELAALLTKEQGKPLAEAKVEIAFFCSQWLQHYSTYTYPAEKVLSETDSLKVIERRFPVGVVAGITPWNFPMSMAVWKMAEALATGNCIILKPSPFTPLTTLKIGQILKDVFPAGVLSVVTGGNEVGEFLTKHDDVNKISFTGSTRTGKAIQAVASNHLIPVTLELGGNDPAIVLEDADPVKAAAGIYWAGFLNCGQVCIAVKRVFVHESKYDAVVEELTKLAKAAKVGDGAEEGTTMGPINNKMQFDRVNMLVEDAKKNGAKVHTGGAPLTKMGDGYFYPPTILTNVAEGTMIVDEEQFGPVMPVMAFKTVDEAVSRANNMQFGLGGSVWGTNVEKAAEVARRIESGTVWVNQHASVSPAVPFGGLKESGVGKQFGDGTMEGCTQARVIRIPKVVARAS